MFMPKKFGKVLGIALAGLLACLLLIFFVSIFFSSRGNSYATRSGGLGGGMMYGTETVMKAPSVAVSFRGDMMNVDSVPGKTSVGMMDRVLGAPDMTGGEKKIIKNGDLNLRVESVDYVLSQAGKISRELGGDISDSQISQSLSGTKSGTVIVKVPVDKFAEAFSRLKETAAVVLSENTTGADVTAQYVDLQARINNKKAAEVTLQALFQRAEKISDVIEVTDKLALVRGEIESLEGQLRYLNSQTDMASITLSLTEDVAVVRDRGFRPVETLKESLAALIQMLGNLTQGLIRFVVVGLPVLLAYGIIFWMIYRLARKIVTRFWPGIDGAKRVMRKK